MLQDYHDFSTIAKAIYGDIILAQDILHDKPVILKKIVLKSASAQEYAGKTVAEDAAKELKVNRAIQHAPHPSLVALQTDFVEDGALYMVFEYCSRGDLMEKIMGSTTSSPSYHSSSHKGSGFRIGQTQKYFRQVVTGVQALHRMSIAHRDLSLENIFVDSKDQCKIGDFGLAVTGRMKRRTHVGKAFYAAPECSNGQAYAPQKIDLWSLGIILYMMLTGSPLFNSALETDPNFALFLKYGLRGLLEHLPIPPNLSSDALDLLENLIALDPDARLSPEEILSHPFLSGTTE